MKNGTFSQIQETISDYLNGRPDRKRVFDLKPQDIDHELFLELAKAHLDRHGFIPKTWEKYMKNYNRFMNMLMENGHDKDELVGLKLRELRDLCNKYEYIEVSTATASGGVSTSRKEVPTIGGDINSNRAKAA